MTGTKKLFSSLIILVAFFIMTPNTASSACIAGDAVNVLWKGKWYPATVLKASGEKCYIHYNGYDNSWDEWVGSNRYQFKLRKGSSANVLWKGKWYPAKVLQRKGSQYYITYKGYDNSWDEWVGNNRIRP